MSQYLLLKKVVVQNANAISGLTYGFPAVTNFLGFAHAISRKLKPELGIKLGGVAVISHQNNVHARQPKGWGDYVFALTRNPLTHQGKTAPINEEGRMNMQVSLIIEVDGLTQGDEDSKTELVTQIEHIIPILRIAGGQILSIENINLLVPDNYPLELRKLMPGFALVDRSDYLAEHYQEQKELNENASLLDAWCDFAQLKYQAEPLESESSDIDEAEHTKKATWHYVKKPKPGYLVPINTGYCAISQVFDAGAVANVRDNNVPAVFVEAAYSIGEWKSIHSLENISQAIWRYEHKYPWYLAKSEPFKEKVIEIDDEEMTF